MKRISHWAAAHPLLSRFTIILFQWTLIGMALASGCFLLVIESSIPTWLVYIFAATFFLAFVFYPNKKEKQTWGERFYLRQKSHDFTLVLSCFMVLMLGCQAKLQIHTAEPAYAQFTTHTIHSNHLDFKEVSSKRVMGNSFKKYRKNLKQHLKQLKKDWKQQEPSKRTWIKVLLTLLAVLVILGLGLLVAALSCSVSCNGMGGLAVVILVIGWGSLIWLGIWGIKKIVKKDWSKPASTT